MGLLLSAQQPNRPQEAGTTKARALLERGQEREHRGDGEEWPHGKGPVPSFLTWLLWWTCLSAHLVDFRTHVKPFAQLAQLTLLHA